MSALLEPALLTRLERLQLATRRPLAGLFTGEHRSRHYGASLDFADEREYHPGDDYRRIDYQAWARLDQLLVRLFEAEEDLTVRLLVDTSRSMDGAKLRQAARIAAAFGFVALVRRDVVTLHTFPLEQPAPRFNGRAAAGQLFKQLDRLRADGETRFAQAAAHLLARPGPPGLTIVVSDLLTAEWQAGLERLPARGSDVAVVHVLDESELAPELSGDVELVDRETGESVVVTLAPETLAEYRRQLDRWLDDVVARCRRANAAYVRVLAGEDLEPLLLGSWRQAGFLR